MTHPSGFAPMDVKVLVKPDPVEEVTKGGIILADTTKDKQKYAATRGTLSAMGPNAFLEWGEAACPAEGDRILYAQYAGSRFMGDDGEEYIICNDEDIIAVGVE